ncbi:hypothetical protein [Mycobacteroides abscessus]|uniref:hypothetical protein n=1 Tax=Mycobacteroides abscessus TaxID=36809 RepID=UPI0009A66118|nr:hypothetical protein [Mycobacteroides abscessus]SKT86227.1 Uncharacterised protein [Mycobacteroides abscessus subsp. massiliense]SKU04835.1 Uncharacterised protein [Mycobacteroides abscessus subsp. massiliense]
MSESVSKNVEMLMYELYSGAGELLMVTSDPGVLNEAAPDERVVSAYWVKGESHGPVTQAAKALIDSSRSGRKRPLWAVPAEEIQSRADEWLPNLEGKTTAEIHRWAEFEGFPVPTAEVWLWAVVHPALGLTCGPESRWGLEEGPQEVPIELRSLVEHWRARIGAAGVR